MSSIFLVTKNCSRKSVEKANVLCDANKRQIYSATEKYVLSQFVKNNIYTRVRTLIVATIYLQPIQNRHMFRSFTVLQCSHQHCLQPVASDVEVVGYL